MVGGRREKRECHVEGSIEKMQSLLGWSLSGALVSLGLRSEDNDDGQSILGLYWRHIPPLLLLLLLLL